MVNVNVPTGDGGVGGSGSEYAIWEKYKLNKYRLEGFGESTSTSATISTWNDTGKRIIYKTYTFDENTGTITLSDPLSTSQSSSANQLSNYTTYPYYYGDKSSGATDNTVYKITNITSSGSSSSKTYTWYYDKANVIEVTPSKGEFIEYIIDTDSNTYPDNGEQDGFWWVKIAEPGGMEEIKL
jgi:hypothetical protein